MTLKMTVNVNFTDTKNLVDKSDDDIYESF